MPNIWLEFCWIPIVIIRLMTREGIFTLQVSSSTLSVGIPHYVYGFKQRSQGSRLTSLLPSLIDTHTNYTHDRFYFALNGNNFFNPSCTLWVSGNLISIAFSDHRYVLQVTKSWAVGLVVRLGSCIAWRVWCWTCNNPCCEYLNHFPFSSTHTHDAGAMATYMKYVKGSIIYKVRT